MAVRGHGRRRGRPQALGVANGGQVGPKSSSAAHFHVRGHEIGHSNDDSSGIGHCRELSLGQGGGAMGARGRVEMVEKGSSEDPEGE